MAKIFEEDEVTGILIRRLHETIATKQILINKYDRCVSEVRQFNEQIANVSVGFVSQVVQD
jgi:hypothetical protein